MPLIQIESLEKSGQLGGLPPFRTVGFQPRPMPVQDTPAPPEGPAVRFPVSLPPFRTVGFQPRPAKNEVNPMLPAPRILSPFFDAPNGYDRGIGRPFDLGPPPPTGPAPGDLLPTPTPLPVQPQGAQNLAPLLAQIQALQSQVSALRAASSPCVCPAVAPAQAPGVVGAPAPTPVPAPASAPVQATSAALSSMFAAPSAGASMYASVGAPTSAALYAKPQESGSLFATVSRAGALSGLPADDGGHALLWLGVAAGAAWWFFGRKGRR
jgi:hypothetical protein